MPGFCIPFISVELQQLIVIVTDQVATPQRQVTVFLPLRVIDKDGMLNPASFGQILTHEQNP